MGQQALRDYENGQLNYEKGLSEEVSELEIVENDQNQIQSFVEERIKHLLSVQDSSTQDLFMTADTRDHLINLSTLSMSLFGRPQIPAGELPPLCEPIYYTLLVETNALVELAANRKTGKARLLK